jgi:hypothetical protein
VRIVLKYILEKCSRDSSVGVVTGYELDAWSSNSGRGNIFLFSTISRSALGPTHPPIEWVPGVKR